jgi:hypothetical protein
MTNTIYDIRMDDFSTIKVSTQTFIIHSNLDSINLSSLQETIPLDVAYEDISDDDEEDGIEFPRIITVSYKGKDRGKPKKRKKVVSTEQSKNFLNCVSFTVQIDPKKNINVKLFNNGVFQLTGCKCYTHAQKALVAVWKAIQKTSADVFRYKLGTGFSDSYMQAYVVSAMRNVDFRLGFEIDREALGTHIINNTKYKIVPIIQGFMGVQLSIPIESVADMIIHKISFPPGLDGEEFLDEKVRYDAFWEIKPSEKVKAQKGKAITIAVFQTGKVLISGIDEMYQEPVFQWFIKEIKSIQDSIMIKKDEPKTFVEYLPKKRRSKFHFKTIFHEV